MAILKVRATHQHWLLYDRILALDPNNASAAFNKGYVHLEYLNQYDSAAFWFEQRLNGCPITIRRITTKAWL